MAKLNSKTFETLHSTTLGGVAISLEVVIGILMVIFGRIPMLPLARRAFMCGWMVFEQIKVKSYP